MFKVKTLFLVVSVALGISYSAKAQTSYLLTNFDGASTFAFKNSAGDLVNDATRIQVGYFSGQIANDPTSFFSGEFRSLIEFTTNDDSTSGPSSFPDGEVFANITFYTGPNSVAVFADTDGQITNVPAFSYPAVNQYLVVRWIDGASGLYNTVASPSWQWVGFGGFGSGPDLDLTASVLYLESSGANTAVTGDDLRATLVPEPGFAGLLMAGLGMMSLGRYRRRKVA